MYKKILFAIILPVQIGTMMALTKEEKLEKLFLAQYNKEEYSKNLRQFFDMIAPQLDINDEEAKSKFSATVFELHYADLKKTFIAATSKLYEETDIDAMIEYNESPAGKKWWSSQTQIAQDMMPVNMSLMPTAQKVAAELKPKKETKKSTAIIHFEDIVEKAQENKEVEKVDQVELFNKEVNNDGLTVVKFSAVWCPPCKAYAPTFEDVAENTKEIILGDKTVAVKYLSVDTGLSQDVAVACKVSSIPTTIFYKNGEKLDAVVGPQAKDVLINKITELAGK